jgi:ketol-acid reductoisomerase
MGSVLYDRDIDRSALEDQKVAVLGYGSQGHAHALNLLDSGFDVRVGLRRDSKSWPKAEEDGLTVLDTAEAVAEADVVMTLLPDMAQPASYENEVRPNLQAGNMLMFAHGFNVHFGRSRRRTASTSGWSRRNGPGHWCGELRRGRGHPVVRRGTPIPGDAREDLAYASGGSGRAGIIETTFAEETETDLFGEQAVLCGGTSALIKAGSRRWSRPATSPRSRTSSACTS